MPGKRETVLAALLFYALLMALAAILALRLTGGAWAYALDDAYIHLSLARSLATAGDWGLTPGHFDNIASSPLWVLLLAAGQGLLGDRAWLPLLLNVLSAGLLLSAADGWLRRRGAGPGPRGATLGLLVLLAPLPVITAVGMEHLLHAWLALLCFGGLLGVLVDGRPPRRGFLVICVLAVAARYETLFLIAPALLLLGRRRRLGAASALLAAALLPVLLMALFALPQGGRWLPDSILLKGNGLDFHSPAAWWLSLFRPLRMLLRNPLDPYSLHLILLILGGGLLLRRRELLGLNAFTRTGLLLLVPAMLAQLVFGSVGWFYRYEAWLLVPALLLGATLPLRALIRRPLPAVLLTITLAALLLRGGMALLNLPRAVANIHGQQLQMGAFLAEYHPGATVVANDLGAISYLAGVRSVDLFGLADRDMARARRRGGCTAAFVDSVARARGADLALLYPDLFERQIPARWVELSRWTIPDNVVCARPTVAFYACEPARAGRLAEELDRFEKKLPPEVQVLRFPGHAD